MSLIDKIKDNLKKSVDIATDRSREAIEVANLKSSIWMMKKQKTQLLGAVGEIVYQQYREKSDKSGEIEKQCRLLEEVDLKIFETEEKVNYIIRTNREKLRLGIKGKTITCTCGRIVEQGEKFCGDCGKEVKLILEEAEKKDSEPEEPAFQEIQEDEEEDLNKQAFCGNCGAPALEEDVFCSQCGANLTPE